MQISMKKTYLAKKKLKAQSKNQTSYNNNAPKGRNKKLDATQRDLNFWNSEAQRWRSKENCDTDYSAGLYA